MDRAAALWPKDDDLSPAAVRLLARRLAEAAEEYPIAQRHEASAALFEGH